MIDDRYRDARKMADLHLLDDDVIDPIGRGRHGSEQRRHQGQQYVSHVLPYGAIFAYSASAAISSRLSPGVRRRDAAGKPTALGAPSPSEHAGTSRSPPGGRHLAFED
jgi:hypothetical protein